MGNDEGGEAVRVAGRRCDSVTCCEEYFNKAAAYTGRRPCYCKSLKSREMNGTCKYKAENIPSQTRDVSVDDMTSQETLKCVLKEIRVKSECKAV